MPNMTFTYGAIPHIESSYYTSTVNYVMLMYVFAIISEIQSSHTYLILVGISP